MLLLSDADVRSILDRDRLVDAVAAALVELSTGQATVPPRIGIPGRRGGLLAAMPGVLGGAGTLEAKLVSVFPANAGIPTHHGVIVLFDPDDGRPFAVLDARAVTAERTAAASAVATRQLARADASVLAVLGAGVQARSHALTVPRVCRGLRRLVIADRSAENAAALATDLAPLLDLDVSVAPSFDAACAEADIVCATTHTDLPVVRRAALRPGTHVNSIGFNTDGREVDGASVVAAFVAVESRASALAPPPAGANDLLWPIRDGLIDEHHIRAELGELVNGTAPGRSSDDELTLYKGVGVAAEDLAAAALLVDTARGVGAGTDVAW